MILRHRFELAVVREDGSLAGRVPVEPDWTPACEWTRFQAVRCGRLSGDAFERECAVEPLWHAELGAPCVGGFRVSLAGDADAGEEAVERWDPALSQDFPLAYLRDAAGVAAKSLVARGRIGTGERYRFLMYAVDAPHRDGASAGVAVRRIAPPIPMPEGSLGALLDASTAVEPTDGTDMPVFVPPRVLDEAAELARAAGECETGGVLVGHLRRDARDAESIVEVTAQIPAPHVEADAMKLTFTPSTWTAVRTALAARARDEIILGWFHSHLVEKLCPGCSPIERATCPVALGFLSDDDRHFQRTVFPRAYSIALVVNYASDAPCTFALFGWRRGVLEQRGFHRLNESWRKR